MNEPRKRPWWRPNPVGLIAGMLLVGFAAFFFYFFGLYEVFTDPFGKGRSMVIIFFMGPLLTAGIALLSAEVDKEDEQEVAVAS